MVQSLEKRIQEYESCFDYRFTRKLPLIIKIEGKSFSKATKNLQRPYSDNLAATFADTMLALVKNIDGATIGYHYSDSISIVSLNDQKLNTDPWLGNRIQDIVSLASSMATNEFNNLAWSDDDTYIDGADISGNALFTAKAFTVPNYTEAINFLICQQFGCAQEAINDAIYYELGKRFSRKEVHEILSGRSVEDRLILLKQQCNIDFRTHYSLDFQRGIACYKVPKTSNIEDEKHKWFVDYSLPIFSDSMDFLYNILSTGHDIFRPERTAHERRKIN